MTIRGPLLTVRQGNEGTFVSWLEDLGLKDFIRRFPIPKLVEWGWLVPQYRYSFPPEEFTRDEPRVAHFLPHPRETPLEQLRDQDWYFPRFFLRKCGTNCRLPDGNKINVIFLHI